MILKAHEWSTKNDFKSGLSITKGYLGFIYHTQGDYLSGIDFYQKSISFNRKNDFQLNLAIDLGNYGYLLDDLEDPRALNFFHESIAIYKKNKQANDAAYLYSYIGQYYSKKGMADSAIVQIQHGLSNAEEPSIKSTLKRNLAEVMANQGDFDKALELINESVFISKGNNHVTDLKRAYLYKTSICIEMKRFEAAQECLNELRALKGIDSDNDPKGALNQKQLSARLAFHFKDYKTAYDHISSAYRLRDDLYNEELVDILKRKSIEFEYQEKSARDSVKTLEEIEIRELKYQANIKAEETGKYFLVGSIISLLLIVGLITRSFIKNKRNTRIIKEQNESLGVKNKEIIDSINYAKSFNRSFCLQKLT
ncbi:MAG: hypothetical protein P8P74_03535 [Crocinitomicaceae bacterium]|nr:hypothetical protein [Crocinitomicaceae bacterium]